MADQKIKPGALTDGILIDTTDNYLLPYLTDGAVGILTIYIKVVSAITGNIVIKARSRGANQVLAWLPVCYTPLHLNGVASNGVMVSTAITAASLIEVDASGQEYSIDAATMSAGSFRAYVVPSMTRI